MVNTPRLGLTLVEGTDVQSTQMKDKINAALNGFDAAVGYFWCTSTTQPSTGLFPGRQIYESDTGRRYVRDPSNTGWFPIGGDKFDSIGVGNLRATKPMRFVSPASNNHCAFPSCTVTRDGRILIVWREGTDHSAIRDGNIKSAFSTDWGRNWTAASTVFDDVSGSDLRDPCLSQSNDGTKIYLTYFKGTAALGAAGVFFRTSTDGGVVWSAETRIDAQPYAASSAPIVELSTGTLVMPYYGQDPITETFDSVWIAKSTDGGTTWSRIRLFNGQVDGRDYQEPWIAMRPGSSTGALLCRYGTAGEIGHSLTTDNTVNWSAVAAKFVGTGRPTGWYVNDLGGNSTFACVYRERGGPTSGVGNAVMRYSFSDGTTWSPQRMLDSKITPAGQMAYSDQTRIGPGVSFCVLAHEISTTSSKLFTTYISLGGAHTPYGAVENDLSAAASNADNVIFGTNFDYFPGTLPDPWTQGGGSTTADDGYIRSTAIDGVPDLPRIYAGVNDMEVEADIGVFGGTDPGHGVFCRMIDGSNYILFTYEVSGAAYKIYGIGVGGGVLATLASTFQYGAYLRWKIIARGNLIQGFVNDQFILAHSLSGANYTAYAGGGYSGVKLNSNGTSTHRCRRFVVRS